MNVRTPWLAARRAAVLAFGLGTLAVTFAGIAAGCGSNPVRDEARRGMVRVEVARLGLPDDGAESEDRRRRRFGRAAAHAERLGEYGLAAEAATHLGKWEYDLGELDRAEAAFREALRLDKQEHQRLRSGSHPLANSAQIAVSLANVSWILEERGELEAAVLYADRALRVNRALQLVGRVEMDLDRIVALYERLENPARAAEYERLRAELVRVDDDGSEGADDGETAAD